MTQPSRQFVVDNSVVMAWCFEDEADRYALGVLESLADAEGIVPAIWPLEVGNVLVVAQRRGRLSEAEGARFLSLLSALPIRVEQESAERMLAEVYLLAREHGLSTYDASYLDLAMRLGLPIATRDASLIKAAKKCKVQMYKPGK